MESERPARNLPAVPDDPLVVSAYSGADSGEPDVPLSQYIWILKRHWWKILLFVAASMLATLVVCLRLTPIYESTAVVDVDRRMPTGILGQEASQNVYNDAEEFLATQVKLIQSDAVLRPVVEKYHLLEYEDRSLPAHPRQSALRRQAPSFLRNLRITHPPRTYILLISYRSPDRQLAADVANAISNSYLEHTYNIRYKAAAGLSHFMEKQLEELRAKMERSSGALARFERELNIINPEEKVNILAARLLQINNEYTSAQGDRVRKEAAYKWMKDGSLEAGEVSPQRDTLRKLTEDYNQALQRFAGIKSRFGPKHPEYVTALAQVEEARQLLENTSRNISQRMEIDYRAALEREQMLEKAVKTTKEEFDQVNARSFEYQTLKREAEGDKKLYEELVRKIKEASINSAFQNNSVRIADAALPAYGPVFPRTRLYLVLTFMLSTLIAVGAAVLSDMLDETLRDPEQVALTLRANVVGTLPRVRTWRSQLSPAPLMITSGGDGGSGAVTTYEDAIRTLRNSILLSSFSTSLRTVMVTSASPSEGKSTTAIYLAVAHAQQRKRTLLIDGDLRRPSVHKRFGMNGVQGLSNVLTSEVGWRDVLVTPPDVPALDVLPAGSASPRHAADTLGAGLTRLLDEAYREYDFIVVDAPPLLGFPEPLQMASAVDGVIVVARAGHTSRKGVANVIATLSRIRANMIGVVLNEVHKQISDSYYYYGHYGKYYRHYSQSDSD